MVPESHKGRNPVVLYRSIDMDDSEREASAKHFPTFKARTAISSKQLVIGRYSVLPFYDAIQTDVDYVGAVLVNNHREHNYIADLRNWFEDLRDLTPKTWYRLEDIDEPGPYILKGKTNSRKFDWKTHCFASDLKAAGEVHWRLSTDGLIGGGNQEIYIRKFVPLKTFIRGINDIPVTSEFRFFTIYGRVICGGYYWANYAEDLPTIPKPQPHHVAFVEKVLHRISGRANFVVVDIAETESGDLILIELNDGQQSGLSMCNADELYSGLKRAIAEEHAG